MNTLRQWVHRRAHHGRMDHAHVNRQRRFALYMTIFAGVRMAVWFAAMALVIAYYAGVGGSFELWFIRLSSLVLWVSFISYYCNFATDFASFMAGMAALFSADSHATAIAADSGPAEDFARALSANADVLSKLDGLGDQVAGLAEAVQVVMAARAAREAAPPGPVPATKLQRKGAGA
jgi:hypothetical protein